MRVAIFTAGINGKKLYQILQDIPEIEVICFVDNNPNKIGQYIEFDDMYEEKIVSTIRLQKMIQTNQIDKVFVPSAVIVSYSVDEILTQLQSLGIDQYKVIPAYIFRKDELDEKDKQIFFQDEKTPNQLQHLQFHLADNCNLNCKRCQHFSNLVKGNQFPRFEDVKRDFERLHELFDDINVIALLGGEPLLNPELDRYCDMLRTLYPYSDIKIITNGLLINKMSEKLIECIETNQIKIHISYYPPLVFLIDDMVEFMRRHNIKYHIGQPVTQFNCKMTIKHPTNPNISFENCRDRCCTTLRDGYLYPCYLPATVHIFNQTYGTEIDAKQSRIDIYQPNITGRDILKRLSYSFDICKYCTQDKWFPWEGKGKQEAKKEDWLVDND